MKKILSALSFALIATGAMADDAKIISQLENMGAKNIKISASPLKGIRTVVTSEGILYVSEDARYVFQGKLYELGKNGINDLTNKILVDDLNALQDEMIIYPAKNEKHVVTVFMDITCHYCHLLHKKIKEYNDLGITIRYLAFPRGGLNTKTAEVMEAIWRAKDRVYALNEAEKGNMPKELKSPNIVKKHYELGVQFGVRGTPAIVTADGDIIGGFLEPKALLGALTQ